jgi:ribose 5-phosphate isomerase RpiB
VLRSFPSPHTYSGEKLNRQLLKLYFDGAFRDGGRSQDSIEQAYKLLLRVDQNEPLAGSC